MNDLSSLFPIVGHILTDEDLTCLCGTSKSLLSLCSSARQSNSFFLQRVEQRLSRQLSLFASNWKDVYYTLEECLSGDCIHFSNRALQSTLCTSLLLEDSRMECALASHQTFDTACNYGSPEVVSLLLTGSQREGQKSFSILSSLVRPRLEIDERTALISACMNIDSEVLRVLLSHQKFSQQLSDEDTLIECFQVGVEEALIVLTEAALSDGVDLSFGACDLLILACSAGHTSLVRLLASAPGMDFEVDNGVPLVVACRMGRMEVVELFLDRSIHQASVPSCARGLVHACECGELNVLKLLLADGRAQQQRWRVSSGFERACEEGQVHIVEFLIREGRVGPLCRKAVLASTSTHESVREFLSQECER